MDIIQQARIVVLLYNLKQIDEANKKALRKRILDETNTT